ncbi:MULTISPECIES: DUF305 domain-containing protein [unclassified Bradyrhizobium]|uniref:DUF305 domain-containing protein n=1 Tax=unclassified Bradyrhizobium TaxID=2631580 RepID=UPI0020B219B7|nr:MULTISPECIES: DUF305 domain-containing protein [unclassified Bradyrhizobium]MCP3398928.1 DUF305 domain-containing protein [Bradyrhizobium sp. CCGB20]MCP3407529.1 DUF305 domain-containing protein [Bradyrhizobium sp. CCGB01]
MEERAAEQLKSHWLAAAQLGFVSSTFSTLISQLAAVQLGRDATVDWMTVAAIPGRDAMLSSVPSAQAIALGIAFHQWADVSWALVFFGVFGRWTSPLAPGTIGWLAIPWAALTSATEWFGLVPLFPFFQPIFALQQPYWIGFLVHLSSALIYPLFAWLRWPFGRAPVTSAVRFAKRWAAGALLVLATLALVAVADRLGWSLPISSRDLANDQRYMRHMLTHHEQGIELAQLGQRRARESHLRALAALMVASQAGENRIFEHWWRGWFSEPMAVCSGEERAAMPGYLTPAQMADVRKAADEDFDTIFIRLMSLHHAGAVHMADNQWHSSGDPRLRLMAHAIRHEQQGEIALMNDVKGLEAVRQATRNLLANNL